MSKVSKHEENDVKRFGHPGLLWAPWRRRPIQALLSAVVFGFLLVAGVRVVGALMRRGGDRDAVRDPRLFRHHTDHRLLTVQSMNEDQAVFCSRAGVHWYDRRSQHLRLYPVADGVQRDVFYDGTNLLSTLYDGSIVDLRSGRMLFRAEPTIPQSDLTWKALDAHGSRLFQVAADPSDPSDPSDPHALVIDKATGNARAVCLYPDKLPREKLDESLKSWAGDSTYRRWMYPDDPNKGDGIPISLRGKKDISPARLERMLSVSRWDKPWVACIERLAARALPSLCAQPDVRDAWFTDGHLFVATKLGIVCLSEDGSPADRRMQHQWTLETQPCPSLDNDTLKGITQVRMVKIDDGSVRGVAIGADGRLYLHTGNGGWVPQHHARTFESYSADDLKACFGNPKYGRLLAVTAEDVALYDLSER
ncbi:MAG: hypothetical protein PHO14_10440, partial [Kiritimatiellae bacterium]|nr:hypothetical protein [Kiritimatiellia bacterium]